MCVLSGCAAAGSELEACTDEVLQTEMRAYIEQRNAEEEQRLESGTLSIAVSKHLQRKKGDPERMEQLKRVRNDRKESDRLALLKKQEQEQQAADGGKQ